MKPVLSKLGVKSHLFTFFQNEDKLYLKPTAKNSSANSFVFLSKT